VDERAADPKNLIWVMPAEEGVSEEVVVVVAGGSVPAPLVARLVPRGVPVVAADSGLDTALELGLETTIAIGDFDSASPGALASAEAAGVRIERHPAEKDATDLELALDLAIALAPRRILVVAARGGRLDHDLANQLLLGSDRYAGTELDAIVGDALVHVVRSGRTLEGQRGEFLTLLAVNGPATGVTTDGLRYQLRGETLEPGSSRGVSNEFESTTARVTVESGVLLAIRPGASE
jgi:thiamine pyrophosphokinase